MKDITNPRELAEAIVSASGVANVVVMLGSFDYRSDIYFTKIPKITTLNTIMFQENGIKVWKQGQFGEGDEIKMNKIPFPSNFQFEFIGPEQPRRKEKENLVYRQSGETEEIRGNIEDFDDDIDELEEPIIEGSIYKCPNVKCDAEYQSLGNLFDHQINRRCFQKTKLRSESVGSYFQRLYIDKYGIDNCEQLTASEKRYKHILWDKDSESISLLPTLPKPNRDPTKVFYKGFVVNTYCIKNPIFDDVKAFVRQKFDEGEETNRHMSYPKIASAIETEKDIDGNPKFFPNKWLDVQQVGYLVSKFIKEKKNQSSDPSEEDISVNLSEENFSRRRDAIQTAVQHMQSTNPLSEQSHPLLLDDGTNICDIAKDYNDNQNGRDSLIMQEDFDNILPILEAIEYQPEGKNRRKAALEIVKFVKTKCGCIPMRKRKA